MNRDGQRSRLQAELAHLEAAERPRLLAAPSATGGRDVADQADRTTHEVEVAQVDHRIHRLRSRLAALDEGPRSASDGSGRGTLVVVDVGEGPETYLMGEFPDSGLPTITPDSPLARALRTVRPGQTATYQTPRGEATVTLLGFGDPDEAVA